MTDPVVEYTSRDMLSVVRQNPKKTMFLSNLLVKGRYVHSTKHINFDRVGGENISATYVNRLGESHKIGRDGSSNIALVAPYTYEEFEYGPSDLDERLPGQTEYEVDPETNAAVFLDTALEDLSDRCDVLEERQIASAIQDGIVEVTGKGVSYTVDYDMKATHKPSLSGADRWTEATSKKLEDLQTWVGLCEDDSGVTPTMALGDRKAMQLLIKDEEILSYLDNRRVEIGMLMPSYDPMQMVTYIGTINYIGFNLQLWTYNGQYKYIDGSGVKQSARYMKDYRISLLNPSMPFEFHFGKIENFDAMGFRAERFPSVVQDPRGKSRSIMMESSPLAGFLQPDAVVTATVATP